MPESYRPPKLHISSYRFLIIGGFNTAIHLCVAFLTINQFGLHILAANFSGFLVATAFSFVANTLWSFEEKIRKVFLTRFFIVSTIIAIVNISLSSFASQQYLNPKLTIFLTALITPIISYSLHRYWTYRTPSK